MLNRFVKGSVLALCLFTSMSAFAWQCVATNARQNGTWVGTTPYNGPYALNNARQYALSFCQQAARTMNPATCHIVSCVPN